MYTVECGNRLRVGVRAKTLACRGLRVGPSELLCQRFPSFCAKTASSFPECEGLSPHLDFTASSESFEFLLCGPFVQGEGESQEDLVLCVSQKFEERGE